ncbi:MAG: histidine kinase [Acidobacteria bacterium]|nr:MAG: histidine kinase [Acidobacteriota bacterium]
MFNRGSFRVKTGYLTAFLLLLISYLLIFVTLQQLLQQTKWLERTDLVINDLETLSSYLNEAESAARGYVLLNDPDHKETFNSTTEKIDLLLKNIDSLTSDNTLQQKNADTLKTAIQEKLGGIYRGILLYEQGGNVITDRIKERGEIGKKLMANIKVIIQKMERAERNLLQQRKEKLRTVSTSIKIITVTSLAIALLLSTYSFLTYSKESDAKRKADEQADLYRRQLESKVHELQAANTELQELRSLEKFTATGRVARTIAHEIRNPLTNIILATDQVKSTSGASEETVMLLDMINRNASRINSMISELLASTKFAQLQYSKVNVNSLLDETIELARDRIELKQISLHKKYSSFDCQVFADVEKMKIAILNIIVNAIEAMEKGKGILEISTTAITGNKCKIDIKDNGSGMNEETLQKLFDPYFTSKDSGNGLGLTNTQNIILNHKGSIEVKSRPREGSVFSITLNTTE